MTKRWLVQLPTHSVLARHGRYEITDEPARVDLDVAFLSRESYWRRGVPRVDVRRSVAMSLPLSAHLPSTARPWWASPALSPTR